MDKIAQPTDRTRDTADFIESVFGEDADNPHDIDWRYGDIAEVDQDVSVLLKEEELAILAQDVIREYNLDCESRAEKLEAYEKAIKLARAIREAKTYPFAKAANVKYPLLMVATLQFAARAYPAIVNGSDIVRVKVNGKDDEQGTKASRAERLSEHMSYQVLNEIPNWERQMDELLHHLPLAGTAIRCVYYDADEEKSVTELVPFPDFVVNDDTVSIKDAPRFTRVRHFYPHEIKERMLSGFYRETDLEQEDTQDKHKPEDVLEQHRRDDLDGDGYAEPYVVTVHKKTQKVLRIVPSADRDTLLVDQDEDLTPIVMKARHEPMYVRYVFMPDPEGKFYGVGFGKLLESIGEAIDTTLNQLLDAAHLQNTGGGFLGGNVDFGKKRDMRMGPHKWVQLKSAGADIRSAVVPMNYPGPSAVLFNLLGTLIEAGKEIGSVKDVLTGDSPSNAPVGTTMALIEQGLQQFTAIYKRIYSSLKDEYQLLYRLNGLYLDDEVYFNFLDDEKAVKRDDYAEEGMDVTPTADPSVVTSMQKMAKVEFAMQFKGQPHINEMEIDRRAFEAAGVDDIEELFAPPPEPDPLMIKREELELAKIDAEISEIGARIEKMGADAGKLAADASVALDKQDLAERELDHAIKTEGTETKIVA